MIGEEDDKKEQTYLRFNLAKPRFNMFCICLACRKFRKKTRHRHSFEI